MKMRNLILLGSPWLLTACGGSDDPTPEETAEMFEEMRAERATDPTKDPYYAPLAKSFGPEKAECLVTIDGTLAAALDDPEINAAVRACGVDPEDL